MQNLNQVIVAGNVTRDPELRQTASGASVLGFGIAVNGSRKNPQTNEWEDVPNFFDVNLWGNRAISLSNILHKGMKVTVQGKLRWTQWQDQSGQNRSKVDITADHLELPPNSQNQGNPNMYNQTNQTIPYGAAQAPQNGYQQQAFNQAPQPVNTTVYDEDVPF